MERSLEEIGVERSLEEIEVKRSLEEIGVKRSLEGQSKNNCTPLVSNLHAFSHSCSPQ